MTEVTETQLPGVGIRYDFTTSSGDLVGVLCHHSGRREIVVYDRRDPDRAHSVLQLGSEEARILADTLGATHVIEALGAIQQRVEGLVLEWIELGEGSPMHGRSIGDGALRARTGASVVAVIRGDESVPAPGPEEVLYAGDTVVAIGRPDALDALRHELRGVTVLAATGGDAALAFIEIGALALVLAVLARVAARLGITAIPLYLIAGLAVGDGGVVPLDVSADFIELAAQIGVLLLLFTLGLEYSAAELRDGLRTGAVPGVVDAVANFTPGLVLGLLLDWDLTASVLLGGVCWISSSGVVSKVLTDLRRLGNRETPAVLNVLVIEDLAMAVYLPVAAAMVAGRTAVETSLTVAAALVAVTLILVAALRWGDRLSALLAPGSNEALLLAVFGLTLLVGGLAEQLQVSSAIGAFLVGLALSGTVRDRATELIEPLRDLFAAVFFVFFSFQIDPGTVAGALLPAVGLTVVTAFTKLLTGTVSARRRGVGPGGQRRAGTALIARGEFSIVIAALGATIADGEELGALAAAYVLLTAIVGPLAAKYSDSLPARRRPASSPG